MSRLGMADLGVASLNDMRDNAEMIAGLGSTVPLIADADAGFGGPLMVGRTVTQYMRSGVAALHLEDQVVNKRCGHLKNKELVDKDVFASRIQTAVNARAQTPGDIVFIARTDALQSPGYSAGVSRLKRAIAVGADAVFLEGINSKEEARKLCAELAPTPVLLTMVPQGVTPRMSVNEARNIGFRLIIYSGLAVTAVYKAVTDAVHELKVTKDLVQVTCRELSSSRAPDVFFVRGLEEAVKFDIAAGGSSFLKGV